jgi:hypothetical protein
MRKDKDTISVQGSVITETKNLPWRRPDVAAQITGDAQGGSVRPAFCLAAYIGLAFAVESRYILILDFRFI